MAEQNQVQKITTENVPIESLLNSQLVKNLGSNLKLNDVQVAKANSAVLRLMTDEKLEGTTQISKVRFCYEVAGLNYKQTNAIAPIKYGNAIQAQAQYQAYLEDMQECGGLDGDVLYTKIFEGVNYKAHINQRGFKVLEIPERIETKALFEMPKVIGYYCYAKLKNGQEITSLMSVQEIEAHANKYSKSYKAGYSPYKANFDAMAIKTCIKAVAREVLKLYPFDRLAKTIALDMAVIDQEGISYKDNPSENSFKDVEAPVEKPKKTKITNKIEMPTAPTTEEKKPEIVDAVIEEKPVAEAKE